MDTVVGGSVDLGGLPPRGRRVVGGLRRVVVRVGLPGGVGAVHGVVGGTGRMVCGGGVCRVGGGGRVPCTI